MKPTILEPQEGHWFFEDLYRAYMFDEGAGTTIQDFSANTVNGELKYLDQNNANNTNSTWGSDSEGSHLSLGVGACIDTTVSPDPDTEPEMLNVNPGAFTLMVRFRKPNVAGTRSHIAGIRPSGGFGMQSKSNSFGLYNYYNDYLYFYVVHESGTWFRYVHDSSALPIGQWYTAIAVYDKDKLGTEGSVLYTDRGRFTTSSIGSNLYKGSTGVDHNKLYIGTPSTTGSGYVNYEQMAFSSMCAWTKALSESQVQKLLDDPYLAFRNENYTGIKPKNIQLDSSHWFYSDLYRSYFFDKDEATEIEDKGPVGYDATFPYYISGVGYMYCIWENDPAQGYYLKVPTHATIYCDDTSTFGDMFATKRDSFSVFAMVRKDIYDTSGLTNIATYGRGNDSTASDLTPFCLHYYVDANRVLFNFKTEVSAYNINSYQTINAGDWLMVAAVYDSNLPSSNAKLKVKVNATSYPTVYQDSQGLVKPGDFSTSPNYPHLKLKSTYGAESSYNFVHVWNRALTDLEIDELFSDPYAGILVEATTPTGNFIGKADDIRYYNKVLTPSEIKQLYVETKI